MRTTAIPLILCLTWPVAAAELESRVLTHYVPQDFLETVVRTEKWTELPLNVKGGLRKDDVVRIWAGGSVDYGNGDQPGQNITGPAGLDRGLLAEEAKKLTLSADGSHAFAILFKAEAPGIHKCRVPGKPLEIKITKDKERLWIGFNDLKGLYRDNHLGKGRRHEHDPLWLRVEVVRTIVD
jgi:hypothetical protein